MTNYRDMLRQEAAVWDAVNEHERPPLDWATQKTLLHNALVHAPHIDALLAAVQPGMTALELGCGVGWLSLAMAARGADVLGLDISLNSLRRAQQWHHQHRTDGAGTAHFAVADLNELALPAAAYDVIATKGTLHHLLETEHVIAEVYRALKPGGLLWVSDQNGDEGPGTTLLAGALMFALPTHISYREKFAGLARVGVNAPASVKASMEAEGLSPFEGVGREHDWLTMIQRMFAVERVVHLPAVTGYLAHHIALPRALSLAVLRAIKAVDVRLVRWGVLQSTGVVVFARKPHEP